MRPKTTGNVLVFQLIGDSFHVGLGWAAMSRTRRACRVWIRPLLVITIYTPAQLFRIVMANARSHEFFARVVN
jgi:hypothetical protein